MVSVYLAPMEAVNCASFRVLCMRRGADVVYTDMIDADDFAAYAQEHSVHKAVERYINPQPDERLAVQVGGRNVEHLVLVAKAVEHFAVEINLNLGCPLGYMLGKKGGAYLLKHPDQLAKLLIELRPKITIPFSVKIRSGWDSSSINAVEVAQLAEQCGVDRIIIHPRTKQQRYRDRADWSLAAAVKRSVKIPVVLSGDIFNRSALDIAQQLTGCDAYMCGRAAQVNPSIFKILTKPDITSRKVFRKFMVDPIADFTEWLSLYKEREHRYSISEIRDHAIWTATECDDATNIKQRLIGVEDEQTIVQIVQSIHFSE